MEINPAQIPSSVKLVLVMSYPSGTTFNIWAKWRWDNTGGNYTLAASKAEVAQSGSSYKYFWDNTSGHLYLTVTLVKLVNPNFVASGVTLYSVQWDSLIYLEATCANSANGFCPATAYNPPGSIFA